MANARICDNCKKVIDDVSITLKGYKVETKEKLGYEIVNIEDFCSFNCLGEYAKKQQKMLEDTLKIIDKYTKEDIIPEQN